MTPVLEVPALSVPSVCLCVASGRTRLDIDWSVHRAFGANHGVEAVIKPFREMER